MLWQLMRNVWHITGDDWATSSGRRVLVKLRDGREITHEVGNDIINSPENRLLILKKLQASGLNAIDVEFEGAHDDEEGKATNQPQTLATLQRNRKAVIGSIGCSAPASTGPRIADYTTLASSTGMKESLR